MVAAYYSFAPLSNTRAIFQVERNVGPSLGHLVVGIMAHRSRQIMVCILLYLLCSLHLAGYKDLLNRETCYSLANGNADLSFRSSSGAPEKGSYFHMNLVLTTPTPNRSTRLSGSPIQRQSVILK